METFEGFGVGNPIILVILRLLLLGIFIYCGWGITKYCSATDSNLKLQPIDEEEGENEYNYFTNPSRFKLLAWVAGVSYSLIQGLRWLRGADYPHYCNDILSNLGEHRFGLLSNGTVTPDPEPLYEFFINTVNFFGIPFWIVFIFYSAILIWGVLLLCKAFPKYAVWALPIFLLITWLSSENIIRQFFAASFFIFAYYFYTQKKYGKMFLMLAIAPLIHFSSLAAEAPFLAIIFTQRWLLKLYNSKYTLIPLFLIFIYAFWFFDTSKLSTFGDFVTQNVDSEQMGEDRAGYIDNADDWLTEEGNITNVVSDIDPVKVGFVTNFLKFSVLSSIIILGFFAKNKDKRIIVAYYLSYLAIILDVSVGSIELYNRMYTWYSLFLCFVIGALMNLDIKKSIKYPLIFLYLFYYSYNILYHSILTYAYFGFGFIWDADIPLW